MHDLGVRGGGGKSPMSHWIGIKRRKKMVCIVEGENMGKFYQQQEKHIPRHAARSIVALHLLSPTPRRPLSLFPLLL